MSEAAALTIQGLHKGYSVGLRKRLPVLSGLEFQVSRGEVYGLLGRNGVGKSTTFRILMGLSRPDAGSVELLGGKPGERDVQLRVGYCPESPEFPPNLTVMEVMRFHASLVKSRVLSAGNRLDWLVEQFDLSAYRRHQIHQLSRGSRQRLALALSLLARPDLLILDEPLTALDPLQRQRVIQVLLDQRRAGTAMIISSHILSELECLCDRLGVMNHGRIRRELSLDQEANAGPGAMDIRIPFEKAKQALLDEPDLEGIREGGSQTFRGVPFESAQDLLQRWSAAGIPILGVAKRRELPEDEVLATFLEDEPAAAENDKCEREGERV